MLFETIPPGCGGRWAFGTIILVYLISYNETCGPTALFGTILAGFYGLVAATCKSGVKHLQIPYIRASNKFDFLCLFLAVWMDALAVLSACGALARTLSTCLDAMTGGLARVLILGRNSPSSEPWPDVFGVAVVFLVTGMFMLGLENTKAFSFLMALGMFGFGGILTTISWIKGNSVEWNKDYFLPNGISSFLKAAALCSFSYPGEMPHGQGLKRLMGIVIVLMICISSILAAGCLSTIVHYKPDKEYAAVPIFPILENINLSKIIPAAACLLVLSSSGAFLELFPELYNIIVRLATSEWKILTKQISYESHESGSPVLAIFIGGSLCAMLAFACPLQNLSHILAASHLCAGIVRAFYLLYSPFRPKFIQQTNDSTLSYSRLSTAPNQGTSRRRSVWSFNVPKPKLKKKSNRVTEKEWLLLGEPSSPRPSCSERNNAAESILSDGEPATSDIEYTGKQENTDSDTSTDIDAIVDEYRQKLKVTTAGPMEKSIRVPSIASWRVTILAIVLIMFGILLIIFGLHLNLTPAYITGFLGIFFISIIMSFIPKYTSTATSIPPILSTISITLGCILLYGCLDYSWPAILIWFIVGLILFIRCDTWCCLCLDRPIGEQMIPSVSGKTATIRIPRPPKGLIIPGRIQRHR